MRLFGRGKGKPDDRKAILAIFPYMDECVAAIRALRERGIHIETAYSPVRSDEINEAMGMKASPVRYFTLAGGIIGIMAGIALAVYTASVWKFVVWGKPPIPFPPYVVVAFEFCILTGVFFNLLGVAVNTRLPNYRLPDHYDARFTEDRYGLLVHARYAEIEHVRAILENSGAEEVHALDQHPA